MKLIPITRDVAFAFVKQHHRHHLPPLSWKFGVGVTVNGVLVGVAIAGRPVARGLEDGYTIEVTRLATLTIKNLCSKLYGAIRRAAKALGYRRMFTYTLASEDGTSLRASGWEFDGLVSGRSWSCPSRPRTDTHPLEDKHRWKIVLEVA